ncbi:hypothetical protein AGOR_G00049440 [Albula goreensis]|uniref:Uncharacterized protein n=1 Tax=Albula goreensis TaxID=1534307 RepID=A0A8T3E0J2_9TELE|nr:hypothetical protein AGOR_G00049440 [Albula goreensis]
MRATVKVLRDLGEDHGNQTVIIAESHDPVESRRDEPSETDPVSTEKRKQPIRSRRAKLQVKPCITKRKLRGSASTGIVGCSDLPKEDHEVASGAENTENNSGAEGPQIRHDVTFNSVDSQSVKTEEEGSGCDSVSHLVLSDVLIPVSEGQVEGTAQEWTDLPEQNTHTDPSETAGETSSTAVMRATVKVLRDLGEDHGNQTVIIAESHDPVESRRDEPSETDPVSTEKRKQPIRSRRAKLQVKPCITKRKLRGSVKDEQGTLPEEPEQPGPAQTSPQTHQPTTPHPDAQQDSVEEAAAASEESTVDQPVQGIVGYSDLPQQDRGVVEEADRTEHSSGEKKLQPKWCSTPLKLSGKLTRPGRAPRGFLSFMSGSGDSGPAAPSRTSRCTSLRSQVNTSCTGKKRTAEGAITKTSSDPSSLNTPPTKVSTTLHDTSAEPSSSEVPGPSQNEFLCSRTPEPDEEPTTVFQYCFTDIFTEVEEPN